MGARQTEESAVRDALAGLTQLRTLRLPSDRRPSRRPVPPEVELIPGWVSVLFLGALVMVAGVAVAAARAGASGPTCAPITYEVQGSPPAFAVAELGKALDEVHARSGLAFTAGEPGSSKLVVRWSRNGVTEGASAGSEESTGRLLGYGRGTSWQVRGGRVLEAADVEIDATASWRPGLDRRDGLAAVFVHELGHAVLGLEHNVEPTSFMYYRASANAPRWTPDDISEIERISSEFGCRPPSPERTDAVGEAPGIPTAS